ncbi:hypothetical protein ACEW7V_02165 [Areca yellow leaf disease phytoplasma]|uniref:hypothetical protein n=1 Tax=Areca yellow leaf disease phytoplasma TaxID=927614 RepID=UPI0035B56AC0
MHQTIFKTKKKSEVLILHCYQIAILPNLFCKSKNSSLAIIVGNERIGIRNY